MYKYMIPSKMTTVKAWPVLLTMLPVPFAWSGDTQRRRRRFESQRTDALSDLPDPQSGSTAKRATQRTKLRSYRPNSRFWGVS